MICIICCIFILIYQNKRNRNLIERLQDMMEAAKEGRFTECHFDESLCSSLESEMAEYLDSSERLIRQAAEEKDTIKTFIADISHQTKTPIANLLLYSELLKEEPLSKEVQEYLDAIHIQTEKLSFLIDSLVKLSRLEAGIVSLHPKAQEIKGMIGGIMDTYWEKAEIKNLEIYDRSECGIVYCDRKWTEEAIGNILDNAIKYTDHGKIEIRTKRYELFTAIEVEDTGPGLSESEIPKIFSRFYRGEESAEKEGVGIGLSLARQILSGEGGYIKVTSEKGRGSVFSIFLPNIG